MSKVWDEFFFEKIQEGLSLSSDSLSEEELEFLSLPLSELDENAIFTPEEAQKLNAKCIGALSEIYARDTTGKNRQAALLWRESNEGIYKYSDSIISGIVQNWYLSVGRAQEKKAAGCLPIIVVVISGFILLIMIVV